MYDLDDLDFDGDVDEDDELIAFALLEEVHQSTLNEPQGQPQITFPDSVDRASLAAILVVAVMLCFFLSMGA